MRKYLYLLLIICTIFAFGCREKNYKVVCGDGFSLLAKVADTDALRIQGLMFQKNLREKEGMLFIFEKEEKSGFWMKNMHFPLDIIWLDRNKRVIDIKKNAQPCLNDDCPTFYPEKEALFVLEVNSGYSERHNIKIGSLLFWA